MTKQKPRGKREEEKQTRIQSERKQTYKLLLNVKDEFKLRLWGEDCQ